MCTDGGVQGEGRAGLYGWAIISFGSRVNGKPGIRKQAAGGGRFASWELRVSSTRAETVALAAAVTALEPILDKGGRLNVHIDNAGVVNTFTRGRHRTSRGWGKVRDRDMWDQIERIIQRTQARGRVHVTKVAAHQDTKKQANGKVK